jgi:hypothetical protein
MRTHLRRQMQRGLAALGAAFLPSVYLTAHIFGQLPTLGRNRDGPLRFGCLKSISALWEQAQAARLFVIGAFSACAMLLVIWPF